MNKYLLTIFSILLMLSTAGAIDISGCSNLNVGGATYYLTSDIMNTAISPCMDFWNSGITLDCQGHIIDGIDAGGSYGVVITSLSGITVRNCRVTDFYSGIAMWDSSTILIDNVTTNSNNRNIWGHMSSSVHLVNVTMTSGSYGIYFAGVQDSVVEDSYVGSNGYGIDTYGWNNDFHYNYITGNNIGLWLHTGDISHYYNNFLNNDIDVHYMGACVVYDYFNIPKQNGTRIYGDGYQIGGNFYAKDSNDGYSQVCADSDMDGFCDSPLAHMCGTDFFPLSLGFPVPTTTVCGIECYKNETGKIIADLFDVGIPSLFPSEVSKFVFMIVFTFGVSGFTFIKTRSWVFSMIMVMMVLFAGVVMNFLSPIVGIFMVMIVGVIVAVGVGKVMGGGK